MIEYKNIIRALSGSEALIRDGMAHSFPVPARDAQGNLTDNFFLFGVSFPSGAPLPPIAHIATCAGSGTIVLHRSAKDAGFPTAPAAEPAPISYEEYRQLIRSYETLYPAVRSFAFKNLITGEQLQLLENYFHTQRVLFAGQMPCYRHIAPEFYSWMIRRLGERVSFLALCSQGEADPSDLPLYLEMAGNDPEEQKRFLGINDAEFQAWQEQGDDVLRTILFSHMMGEDFTEYSSWPDAQKLAARSFDPNALDAIKHEDDT